MASLNETMTSGVWLEYYDAEGRCLGRAVYLDWRGKPLPASGDLLTAEVQGDVRRTTLRGVVERRHFELQQNDSGGSELWVRIEARVVSTRCGARPATPTSYSGAIRFSDN